MDDGQKEDILNVKLTTKELAFIVDNLYGDVPDIYKRNEMAYLADRLCKTINRHERLTGEKIT